MSPGSSTCTEKVNVQVGDFSCTLLEIVDKENNMDDVLITALPNSQDILEDMLKDHVENDWILMDHVNNYEVLYEIREDFSEYDDLIASFLT